MKLLANKRRKNRARNRISRCARRITKSRGANKSTRKTWSKGK